jgi:valyl-tRNA synthetase
LDVNQFKIGRRLAIKLLNASKFVLGLSGGSWEKGAGDGSGPVPQPTEALDRALLSRLRSLIDEATEAFDGYDYARALERAESFFWSFCDDYVELVKSRAYGTLGEDRATSAQATLRVALAALLRLFAPFLPFVTEEVWSWWQEGSVHRAAWPAAADVAAGTEDPTLGPLLEDVTWVLGQIRSAKSAASRSMRWPVQRVTVRADGERLAHVAQAADDLKEAGTVAELVLEEGPPGGEDSVAVELADAPVAS